MLFEYLSERLSVLEKTSSRLEATAIIAALISSEDLHERERWIVTHLLLGQLRPPFDRLEFGMASKAVQKIIAEVCSVSSTVVISQLRKLGDLGVVYSTLAASAEREPSLFAEEEKSKYAMSVAEIYAALITIAETNGVGSVDKKQHLLKTILQSVTPNQGSCVLKLVLGKLRLGFSDKTVLDALSWAIVGDKTLRKEFEQYYQLYPDIGEIVAIVMSDPSLKGLRSLSCHVGVPIVPALAQRLKSSDEMIEKMGLVSIEPKYDGTRVQIHFDRASKNGWVVRSFTRTLDESTAMFPELHKLSTVLSAESAIIDAEAIAYDPESGALLPFQETITRKRKHEVTASANEKPLRFFLFDLMYFNGSSLLDKPLVERQSILRSIIQETESYVVSQSIVTQDPEEIRAVHKEFLDQGLEGAMIKKAQGSYTPDRQGWNWVKFKEPESQHAKLSDTIDAVVMGLYAGQGKRAVLGVGAFLVGILTAEGEFRTISKIGTGLRDEQWRELWERTKHLQINEKPHHYNVPKQLYPDYWIDPQLIVEIAADEITESPLHTAGKALRFPRLVRFREDKNWQETTTIEELSEIK